jgi:hypothetical protein
MTGGTESTLASRTRLPRYVLAFCVVLVGAFLLLQRDARTCHDEIPATGKEPVPVCAPVAATDAEVVASLAVVLMLLAPDLGEAGIAGVTLKRRAEEAKAEAATARADVAAVRLAMTTLRQEVQVSATATNTTVVESGAASLAETLARIGLLKGAVPPREPAPPRETFAVSRDAHALMVSASLRGMTSLLPEEWRPGTVVLRIGEVTLTTGPDLTDAARHRLLPADGPLDRAARGEFVVADATSASGAVVAAPVGDAAGAHLGEVVVVLPAGVASPDPALAFGALAALQAAAAALAAYALNHAVVRPRAARPVDSPA